MRQMAFKGNQVAEASCVNLRLVSWAKVLKVDLNLSHPRGNSIFVTPETSTKWRRTQYRCAWQRHSVTGTVDITKSSMKKMDKGRAAPQKTFVSTFQMDFKHATPKLVGKGIDDGLDHRGPAWRGTRKQETSTENSLNLSCLRDDTRVTEPLQHCTLEERNAILLQGGVTGSQPLRISLLQKEKETSDKKFFRQPFEVKCRSTEAFSTPRHSRPNKEKSEGTLVEFLDAQDHLEVQVGTQATLECSFRSCSFPVASCWIYNREQVVVDRPGTRVKRNDTASSVEISQVSPEDAGAYTLIVRNPRGSAHHTINLRVIDRPHPPASCPVVSKLSSQSLVLAWSGSSYDGGSAVTGYVVEMREQGPGKPGDWRAVVTRCKNTSYRVSSGLDPHGVYHFRVRAYNSVGVSEPSAPSDSVKLDPIGEPEEEPKLYLPVTINTTNQIKDHYNVHEKLGVGKFGSVFRLSHKESGQVCAGKFYRARSSGEKAVARQEIKLMKCLRHPKLVECLGAYDNRSEIVMLMEYIAGGELFTRIVDDNFEHTEPNSARYIQQLLEGLQFVHQQNIVHLDLKPENIVCVDSIGTRIKIIDFGLAAKLEPGVTHRVMHGTPEFVSPEVISYEPVGLATDMWSVGVICFILLSGESPFQGNTVAETLGSVTAASYKFDEESFEDISDLAKDFISALLKKDMRCRLLCDGALAHPWMVSFTSLVHQAKSLKKDKMRRYLAKHKWMKTGQAILALQRIANLTNRLCPGSSGDEANWKPEAERAIKSLEKELRGEPSFKQVLSDTRLPRGSSARLTCHVQAYPEAKVLWLLDEEPVKESLKVTIEYEDDGMCTLVLNDLGPSDSGIYKCRATNSLGEAMCSAKLNVGL
ncbi:myosin light chain kinase, smooth muscle isoform X2 [Esox lucius]|uniref:myosin light chain kinase, smooth muscle isoform X2 n=1 Tax=Esox lucius TaxID=8010 RepID=UPI000576C2CC|nr:myosin light chain kinase, smooth muscle isoform X2 [Esox lucius]